MLAKRRSASQEFFSTAAGQWDRLRADLFGDRADLVGLLGLLDESWTVADLGCGTGQVAELLAPFVAQVIAVDESTAMLNAARKRLRSHENVAVREGDLGALPIDDESRRCRAAVPRAALHRRSRRGARGSASACSSPAGACSIVDMMPHERDEFRDLMGHVWQGFGADELVALERSGRARRDRVISALPADPAAKGPTLFAASARRRASESRDTTNAARDAARGEHAPPPARIRALKSTA